MTLLLKKRLFSSPAAFAHTVAVYAETLRSRTGTTPPPPGDDVPEWLEEFWDDVPLRRRRARPGRGRRAGPIRAMQPDPTDDELALLERMLQLGGLPRGAPDAKARH